MTVKDAIKRSAVSYPSDLDKTKPYEWLCELEARICTELYKKSYTPISELDDERTLSAPDGYCEIYPLYLIMKRELYCGDSSRYAFYSERFEQAYKRYADHVVRTGPVGAALYFKTV